MADQAISALTNGRFVAVWQYMDQDGDGFGVYGRVYGANGYEPGNEFQINTHTPFDQAQPDVAALADGGFIVTWHSDGQDGDNEGIYAQRFTSTNNSATAAGTEFQVNTYTTNSQVLPSTTGLANGSFVITWQSYDQDGSYRGVYAQMYDAVGDAIGSEFQVNTETANSQRDPAIASLSDGGFVITWSSWGQDGSENGVYGQAYDQDGNAVGNEFQINSFTGDGQQRSAVDVLNDGSFIVVWESLDQDGSGVGVYSQRFVIDKPGDEAPADISLSTTIVDEDLPASSVIADITSLDPDFGDSHTYEIVNDLTHGATFSINGANELVLETPVDFDNPPSQFDVTIRATDQDGLMLDKTFDLTIRQTAARTHWG